MPFFTIFNRQKREKFQQDLSREVEPVYSLDKDGHVVKSGDTNVYAKIQQYKDECDVYNVIKSYEGDITPILPTEENSIQGVDFTNIPKDVISSMHNVNVAMSNWLKMPKGLRDLYHDNVSEFMKASPEDISKNIDIYARSLVPDEKPTPGGDN